MERGAPLPGRARFPADWERSGTGAGTRYDWYFRSPDGESYDSARARIEAWLGELSGVVVAVTHGLVSRLIRGAYLDLPVDEALALPVPQGVIWRLAEGRIETLHA